MLYYIFFKDTKNGQELYSYQTEKDKANELLTKISRKGKGYDSYLNLLEEKEI